VSTYKTVRGKIVTLGGISLAIHDDGALQINLHSADDLPGHQGRSLLVSEEEAQRLYDLMGDVLEWTSNAGTTEAKMNKMGEQDDADFESGKIDHIMQHGPAS